MNGKLTGITKKITIAFLAMVMTVAFMPVMAFADDGDETAPLPEAVNGVITLTPGTYELSEDVNATIKVEEAGEPEDDGEVPGVTLLLNGHNITSNTSDAIVNHGNLQISGKGTVSTNAKSSAAIATFPGSYTLVTGGTYHSASWYVIKNTGEMDIYGDDGVTIEKTSDSTDPSSVIDNGWYGAKDTINGVEVPASERSKNPDRDGEGGLACLNIYGGTFTGNDWSSNVIKNDDYGYLKISDGTFTNHTESDSAKKQERGNVILNWNTANISGGTFAGEIAITNASAKSEADQCKLNINGGTFNGTSQVLGNSTASAELGVTSIQKGTFNGPFVTNEKCSPVTIFGGTFNDNIIENAKTMKNLSIGGEDGIPGSASITKGANTYYAIGGDTVRDVAEEADENTTIEVTNVGYDAVQEVNTLSLWTKATVINHTSAEGTLTVNGKVLAKGETAESYVKQIESLTKDKEDLQKKLDEAEKKAAADEKALEDAKAELAQAQADLKVAQDKVAEAEAAKKAAEEKSGADSKAAADAKAALEKAQADLKAAQDKVKDAEAAKKAAEEKSAADAKAAEAAKADLKKAQDELTAAKGAKPAKTKVIKVTKGKKKVTVTWKAIKRIEGYQIQYSTSKKFTKKTTKAKSGKFYAKKMTISKLKSKKTYYVRVRTYVKYDNTKVYSDWSNVKSAKTK